MHSADSYLNHVLVICPPNSLPYLDTCGGGEGTSGGRAEGTPQAAGEGAQGAVAGGGQAAHCQAEGRPAEGHGHARESEGGRKTLIS